MSDEIIDALIEQLMSKVNEEEPALLMTTEPDSYGTFRTMHRKAQKLMNEWLEEPEEETREELEVDSKQAWGALREWLLTALSNGDWNPEWLAWTTYTLLYGSDPWETHEKILEIIAKWMKLHPEPEAYNEDGYKACIKKLDQVLGDSTGEPMLLLPLSMISVINDLSLTDIEHKTDEATKNSIRDTLSPSAIEELQQLRTLIKKIRLLLKEISTNAAARDINLTTTRIDNCYGSLTSLISSFAGPEEEPEPEPEPEPEREAAEPEPVPEPDQTATPTPPEKTSIAAHQTTAHVQLQPIEIAYHPPLDLPVYEGDAMVSRNKACVQLEELTSFFRATEPHSPISFLLEKALRWSKYTLPELLAAEMGADEVTCKRFCAHLGLDNITGKS